MNLIDAARRLDKGRAAFLSHAYGEGDHYWICAHCHKRTRCHCDIDMAGALTRAGHSIEHASDCPVPVLPQIVRALEAAQAVAANVDGERPVSSLPALLRSVHAMQSELWGPSQNAEAGTSI